MGKASVKKIIWNDWPALAAAVGIPIIWVIQCIFPLLKKGAKSYPEIGLILTVICIVMLGSRISRVKKLFEKGVQAVGVITFIQIVKDRGRLEYEYEVEGQTVRTWCPIHKTKQVLSLKTGDQIDVLYDSKNPKRSLIENLFAESE